MSNKGLAKALKFIVQKHRAVYEPNLLCWTFPLGITEEGFLIEFCLNFDGIRTLQDLEGLDRMLSTSHGIGLRFYPD